MLGLLRLAYLSNQILCQSLGLSNKSVRTFKVEAKTDTNSAKIKLFSISDFFLKKKEKENKNTFFFWLIIYAQKGGKKDFSLGLCNNATT